MTKEDFLILLKENLSDLPEAEADKAIAFYNESIDDRIEDGLSEEEAVSSLGKMEEVIEGIRSNLPLAVLIGKRVKESHNKADNKTLWMVLAVCGFPLWLPLAIAFAAVILAVYVSLWAVIISLYAVVFSFGLAAVGGFIAGIIRCFLSGFWQGVALVGVALCFAGLFMITVKPMFWLTKKITCLTSALIKKIKKLFITKEVNA